jgi:PLP dependent protein
MSISDNLKEVRDKIEKKKHELGINYPITIIGVTKTMSAGVVKEAFHAGIDQIGESKVQEAEKKFLELDGLKIKKHLIGHLQENKVNKAAALFDFIQSIDSVAVATKLNNKLAESGKTMPVLVEVNVSGEESKFGIDPDDLEETVGWVKGMKFLKLTGLMTIGPLDKPENVVHQAFATLFSLRERMEVIYTGLDLPILSMGMSDDFEIAVEEGATMLRLGRVLFGDRMINQS